MSEEPLRSPPLPDANRDRALPSLYTACVQSALILVILTLALLSGPSAFILLLLTHRRTGEPSLRPLALCLLGLCLIVLGNSFSFALNSVLRIGSLRVEYLIMNEVFISALMTGAFLCLFVLACARLSVSLRMRGLFWSITALFVFIALSLPALAGGPSRTGLGYGYLASIGYIVLCQSYALFIVLRHREGLPSPYRGLLPPFNAVLLAIGLASIANSLLHLGPLPPGPEIPSSPFFFLAINLSIIFICARLLLSPEKARSSPPASAAEAMPELGLSRREREILPLLIEGLSNEEISERLFISPHTVKNHVTSIFRKAGVSSRFELLKRHSSSA
jgi:DNA-binding CsgD family transcriptional regulator